MRLKHVAIQNFKGVRGVEFPTDEAPHALRSITALLGDNGSGKTSVFAMQHERSERIKSLDGRWASYGACYLPITS